MLDPLLINVTLHYVVYQTNNMYEIIIMKNNRAINFGVTTIQHRMMVIKSSKIEVRTWEVGR